MNERSIEESAKCWNGILIALLIDNALIDVLVSIDESIIYSLIELEEVNLIFRANDGQWTNGLIKDQWQIIE